MTLSARSGAAAGERSPPRGQSSPSRSCGSAPFPGLRSTAKLPETQLPYLGLSGPTRSMPVSKEGNGVQIRSSPEARREGGRAALTPPDTQRETVPCLPGPPSHRLTPKLPLSSRGSRGKQDRQVSTAAALPPGTEKAPPRAGVPALLCARPASRG